MLNTHSSALQTRDRFAVRQVQAFIRHGERMRATPGDCWAGDQDTAYSCNLMPVQGAWPPAQPRNPVDWSVTTLRGGMNKTQPKTYELPGNCTLGQLTEPGRQMQLNNGAALRAAYVGANAGVGALLPDGYVSIDALKRDVFLRSDDGGGDRTMLSGMALASALLVPEGAASRPRDPLPWNLYPEHNDTMNPGTACPRYNVERGIVLQGKAFQAFANSNATKTLFGSLPGALWPNGGGTVSDWSLPFDCAWSHWCPTRDQPALRDAIPAALLAQGPIPGNGADGKSGSIMDRLNWFQGKMFGFLSSPDLSGDPNMVRYGAGPLMGDVLSEMQAAAGGNADAKKFVLVSGHDTGPINPMLGALEMMPSDPYEPPPFAAMIVVELLERSAGAGGGLYVRVVYNGEVQKVPWAGVCGATAPGGDWLCEYDGFTKRVAAMVPTAAECAATA